MTLKKIEDLNKTYKYFLDIFIDKVKVKFKSDESPWITKGIAKSSKRLYEKFLKNRTPQNEET